MLGYNAIGGSIPAAIGNLPQLANLNLQQMALTGAVPAEVGNLANLVDIRLSDNPGLAGPLPAEMTSLAKLRMLDAQRSGLCAPNDEVFQAWLLGLEGRYVTNCNRPPTANAGGPYSVAEGGSAIVSGTGTDPDTDNLTYAWDLNGDGVFEWAGTGARFSAATSNGPGEATVALRVCDQHGPARKPRPASPSPTSAPPLARSATMGRSAREPGDHHRGSQRSGRQPDLLVRLQRRRRVRDRSAGCEERNVQLLSRRNTSGEGRGEGRRDDG